MSSNQMSVDLPALVEQCASEIFDALQQEAQTKRPRFWEVEVVSSHIVSWVEAVQRDYVLSICLSPVEKLYVKKERRLGLGQSS